MRQMSTSSLTRMVLFLPVIKLKSIQTGVNQCDIGILSILMDNFIKRLQLKRHGHTVYQHQTHLYNLLIKHNISFSYDLLAKAVLM